MKGKLFVIDGLDGSGKATQRTLLQEHLAKDGYDLRGLSFPNYESPSSALVKMYLGGELGQKADEVNAYAASSFYAVDRYASYRVDWGDFYETGGHILADRYATSNLIHQISKLPKEQWEAFAQWASDYEYHKLGIPKPDLVMFLEVDIALSQQLLQKRYGDESKRDIHEKDLEYLARCREAALWCVQTQGWQAISCTQNGQMRTAEAIHETIYRCVKEIL